MSEDTNALQTKYTVTSENQDVKIDTSVSIDDISDLGCLTSASVYLSNHIKDLQELESKIIGRRVELGCPVATFEKKRKDVSRLLFSKTKCNRPNCPGVTNCSCSWRG